MEELSDLTVGELLSLHAAVGDELRQRGISCSTNNPTGDLAEYLFCQAFGWVQQPQSVKSFDAIDADGMRYQIKGRRIHSQNRSRQLSAIRDPHGFDFLAAVLLDHNYLVLRAAIVPAEVVREQCRYTAHTNSHLFHLRDSIWDLDDAVDVAEKLRAIDHE